MRKAVKRQEKRKPKFRVGQVVRDLATNGRYAQILDLDDLYATLKADSMVYDVPIANIRAQTAREAGPRKGGKP